VISLTTVVYLSASSGLKRLLLLEILLESPLPPPLPWIIEWYLTRALCALLRFLTACWESRWGSMLVVAVFLVDAV
jgi:hypothetical protein